MLTSSNSVYIVASPQSWIEGDAIAQLEATAKLPGIVHAVGLPDLHPGRGTPIGAAFFAEGVVYPHLVGSDIGCGMALFRTGLSAKSTKVDRLAKKLHGLEDAWEDALDDVRAAYDIERTMHDAALGTIGGGNHFAELLRAETVLHAEHWSALGLDATELLLLVHSGSRGLGEAILRAHTSVHGTAALRLDSEAGRTYLTAHDHACRWAIANRVLIAARFLDCISGKPQRVLDVCHNSVTRTNDTNAHYIHRKGAAPHGGSAVVIPGSRGAFSYLMKPTGDGSRGGYSLAHGAGRKWKRSEARDRIRAFRMKKDLERTDLGSRVLCEDQDLLYEEAPEAYKDITRVIRDLEEHGLAKTSAIFRPVLTYKVRKTAPRAV